MSRRDGLRRASRLADRTSPLRKIIGTVDRHDLLLECGHRVRPPSGPFGVGIGVRRRCYKCAEGLPPEGPRG
jgi:hypothetical protein